MSYEPTLQFSLKPPKGVLDFGRGLINAVVGGVTVTLPNGQVVRAADLPNVVSGSRVNVAQPQPGPTPGSAMSQVNDTVQRIPGGWLTIAGVGLGVVFLAMNASRRRA